MRPRDNPAVRRTSDREITDLLAIGDGGNPSGVIGEFEFDELDIDGLEDILKPERINEMQPATMTGKESLISSPAESDTPSTEQMYAKLLSEDRMPSRVKNSKQASLTRYTWCVFEIFKCSREESFRKKQIIEIIDSTGVCDQSRKDQPSMYKRLSRVLEVLTAIEVIEINPSTQEYKLSNSAKTQELLARPAVLYSSIRKKREICASLARKRDLKTMLENRKESLLKLINRNKSPVSVAVLNPGILKEYNPLLVEESKKIRLDGHVLKIPARSEPKMSVSPDKHTMLVESKQPLPKPEVGWTILDKLDPIALFEFSKNLLEKAVFAGNSKM